ncbi:MAG: SDR family NAD(P)-dependent oxidoreductase, partial [Thermoplasmatota archaeon]
MPKVAKSVPVLAACVPLPRAVVLDSGCSSGIGRESVLHLRKAGALVVATARDVASIRDLEAPGDVEALRLDVTSEADRAAAVAEVLRRHGRIDALVNNAGFGATRAVEDTPVEQLRSIFEVNLFGAHDLARRVLPGMRAQGHGRIVNVSSVAGHIPVPMLGAYCASKFALRALTEAMDNEVR